MRIWYRIIWEITSLQVEEGKDKEITFQSSIQLSGKYRDTGLVNLPHILPMHKVPLHSAFFYKLSWNPLKS